MPLRGSNKGTKNDMFDEKTLRECDIARLSGTKSKIMVTNLLKKLVVANEEKKNMGAEIVSLKEENMRVKEEIKQEQVVAVSCVDKILGLLREKPLLAKNLVIGPLNYPSLVLDCYFYLFIYVWQFDVLAQSYFGLGHFGLMWYSFS